MKKVFIEANFIQFTPSTCFLHLQPPRQSSLKNHINYEWHCKERSACKCNQEFNRHHIFLMCRCSRLGADILCLLVGVHSSLPLQGSLVFMPCYTGGFYNLWRNKLHRRIKLDLFQNPVEPAKHR